MSLLPFELFGYHLLVCRKDQPNATLLEGCQHPNVCLQKEAGDEFSETRLRSSGLAS